MKVDKVKFAFSSVPVDSVVAGGLSIPIVTGGQDHHLQHVFEITDLCRLIYGDLPAFEDVIAAGCLEAIMLTTNESLALYVTIIGFARIGPVIIKRDSISEPSVVDEAVQMTTQLTRTALQYLSSLEG